ncbi:hypothetical protein BDA96_07G210000 [Sorghum bicolor]|uniref:Uncharacterized protein n=1 Tax=Sorghum bicolor TaxID=4558 RepID=A0A921UBA3_SORBI|nr:hypothetical protein BDA96_07G210000 [Sorghum bicolor]
MEHWSVAHIWTSGDSGHRRDKLARAVKISALVTLSVYSSMYSRKLACLKIF